MNSIHGFKNQYFFLSNFYDNKITYNNITFKNNEAAFQSQKTKSLAKINRKCMLLKNLSKNFSDLSKFLNSMILGGSEMSEGDGVNLLSIHASKGLEFKEVYVIDLMDGRFPNRKLMSKGGSLEE